MSNIGFETGAQKRERGALVIYEQKGFTNPAKAAVAMEVFKLVDDWLNKRNMAELDDRLEELNLLRQMYQRY